MSKSYIGTKVITAWEQEKDGLQGYGVQYPDGYVSWSPKGVFEAAYSPFGKMSFSHALFAVRHGKRVARAGWNGKGMWLRLFQPFTDREFSIREENPADLGFDSGTLIDWIGMKTADNKFVPWLASQTDMLADDWMIVE